MGNIPMKEILMFSLIILGIIIFIFSIYLLSFVGRGYYYRFPGLIAGTGIFLIFYSMFEGSREKLAIASFLLITLILITLCYMVFYPVLYDFLGFTKPDNGWAYILLPILLVSLIITFVLYPLSHSE
jgi:hypothetical protein